MLLQGGKLKMGYVRGHMRRRMSDEEFEACSNDPKWLANSDDSPESLGLTPVRGHWRDNEY